MSNLINWLQSVFILRAERLSAQIHRVLITRPGFDTSKWIEENISRVYTCCDQCTGDKYAWVIYLSTEFDCHPPHEEIDKQRAVWEWVTSQPNRMWHAQDHNWLPILLTTEEVMKWMDTVADRATDQIWTEYMAQCAEEEAYLKQHYPEWFYDTNNGNTWQ